MRLLFSSRLIFFPSCCLFGTRESTWLLHQRLAATKVKQRPFPVTLMGTLPSLMILVGTYRGPLATSLDCANNHSNFLKEITSTQKANSASNFKPNNFIKLSPADTFETFQLASLQCNWLSIK